MSKLPLAACRVLVTRPTGQQRELTAAIEAAGGEAISLPLLAIESIGDAEAEARLRENLSRLQDYELLIFVSVNAVRFGAGQIAECGAAISPKTTVFAVGTATAREAASLLDCPVHGPTAGSGSESLLELPQLEDVEDRRIAIFRGEGGRELLAAELRRRGASVDYLEVYRRTPVKDAAGQLQEILSESPPDVAVITSAEALARWRELLDEIAGPAKSHAIALPLKANDGAAHNADHWFAMPVAVPSQRVAKLAAQHGFTAVIDAGDAGANAIVEALAEHFGRRRD